MNFNILSNLDLEQVLYIQRVLRVPLICEQNGTYRFHVCHTYQILDYLKSIGKLINPREDNVLYSIQEERYIPTGKVLNIKSDDVKPLIPLLFKMAEKDKYIRIGEDGVLYVNCSLSICRCVDIIEDVKGYKFIIDAGEVRCEEDSFIPLVGEKGLEKLLNILGLNKK